MKALLQRVSHAKVSIHGELVGSIGSGVVIFLGVRSGDHAAAAEGLARKTTALRMFADDQGRMNRSLTDTGGSALIISQFTLYADTRKGNRPGFSRAGNPDAADALYRRYIAAMTELLGASRIQTGRFGACMQVELVNDGPVTLELCTDP